MLLKQRNQTFQITLTVENPNWQEVDQLAINKAWPKIWTQDYMYQERNPASDRVEALNQGPSDYNTSALVSLSHAAAIRCYM